MFKGREAIYLNLQELWDQGASSYSHYIPSIMSSHCCPLRLNKYFYLILSGGCNLLLVGTGFL